MKLTFIFLASLTQICNFAPMFSKRLILILVISVLNASALFAQSPLGQGDKQLSNKPEKKKEYKAGNAWTLDLPTGSHIPSSIDTLTYNYQRENIPSMISDAYATQGNLGGEGIDMIFFNRPDYSKFFFNDAVSHWIPTFEKQKFYNVYVPTTILSYNFGGNKDNSTNRLKGDFAGNVNRRIGIGANIDYIHSKGCYSNQAAKNFNFGLSFYYLGDRYEAQAFYNQFGATIKENGGITDELYITDPAVLQGGVDKIEAKSIPTKLNSAQSKLNGSEFYMNHAYKIGFWKEEQVNDTLTRQIYIPVTKFIYSLDYRYGHHEFTNRNSEQGNQFWENTYFTSDRTDDRTKYWTLSHSVAVQMIEGFQKWAKFGLAAYATYEMRNYRQINPAKIIPEDGQEDLTSSIPEFNIEPKTKEHLLWIGGRISKQQGSIIKYNADAKFGLIGSIAGDIDINGDISTRFRMLGDTVVIKAFGFFRNTAVPYLFQKYISNHFIWNNNFGKTRSFRIGGELDIPWTKTTLRAGVENVQNYIYFNSASFPVQHSGSVQIFAASISQRLRFGIWNWDNRLTYQTSSNQSVIPLPALSVYSNMYLKFIAFKVLKLQIGIDCDYYTRYNGLELQPATMTFHTTDRKVGNYAFCNAYITARLYKVRFYVLYSHVNQGWFSKNYFSMPGYPLNPRRLMFGLSVDFAN